MKKFKLPTLSFKRILISVGIFVIFVSIISSILLYVITYKADSYAKQFLQSSRTVNYSSTADRITYLPIRAVTEATDKAFIFYPGGLVEPESYAPICNGLAESGYPCFIAKMPFNLAVFGIDSAESIINEYPTVFEWYIGGHSLGGPMASRYIEKSNDQKIKGVFYLGSYTDITLSEKQLKCVSIVGQYDSVLRAETYTKNIQNFPKDCQKIIIEGGNHSQFGSYGLQNGDTEAKIKKEEQHLQVIEYLQLLTQ
jgi:hypothetical protein